MMQAHMDLCQALPPRKVVMNLFGLEFLNSWL